MARASWTYELPPFVADRRGIEAFAVETAESTHGGTVAAVLDHDDSVYVVVERSRMPGRPDLRAVTWAHVDEVDPDNSVVRLDLTDAELDASLALDPDKKIEGGEGAAARRRVELPAEIPRSAAPTAPGPRPRRLTGVVAALAIAGVFAFFAAYLLLEELGIPWGLAPLVVPIALIGAAVVFGVRLARDPYEANPRSRHRIRKPSTPGSERPPERTIGET
jgi:hypothetical protein